jgi:hypothetical protein
MLKNLSKAALLILTVTISANAYILVLRDGRRLEIPSDFSVTRTTLTYEISPGFYKTLLVALLDVPATERANHELAGSFFKHVQKEQSQSASDPASVPTQRARTTVTNLELEAIAARRIESEKQYERRRAELGLPTAEETRRQRSIEESAASDRAREKAEAAARDEAYWRQRARSLRNEIATTDAQINYVRARLAELPASNSYTQVLPYYWPYGIPGGGIYGRDRRRIYNGRGYPNVYGYPNIYNYPNVYGYPNIYGYPNVYGQTQSESEERSNLTQRLDELTMTRTALNVRWSQLEDEARDARVPQIWLEP